MSDSSLQQVIRRYLKNNIPFVLFRYPGTEIQLIAQYYFSLIPFYELNVDEFPRGFLVYPFNVYDCPILFIQPDVFTSNFNSINLDEIPDLRDPVPVKFNETVVNKSAYLKHIQQFQKHFSPQGLQKAIYSRIVAFPPIGKYQLLDCYLKMENLYTDAFCYLINLNRYGIWMGATPERLLSYKNGIAKTVALAGTKTKSETSNWSKKELDEQHIVSTYIKNLSQQFKLKVLHQSETQTIEAGNLKHLKTSFEIDLPKQQVVPFLNALHPTPAVGGFPQKEAIELIQQTETYNRQYYAGYLGMITKPNEFDFYVNLRCAKIANTKTLAFVGGGITASSVAENEWQETINKSETIKQVLT